MGVATRLGHLLTGGSDGPGLERTSPGREPRYEGVPPAGRARRQRADLLLPSLTAQHVLLVFLVRQRR